MISRLGVAVMAIALALYIVLAGQRALMLLSSGEPVAIVMGIALIVLPLIGLWALMRELVFGLSADRLGRRLAREGGMPEDQVDFSASGRPVKTQVVPLLPKYERAAAESSDWRDHYRLGVVRDAAGRRREARASIRRAIQLDKDARTAG